MNARLEYADLPLEARDGIAWVTFNRPQKANALTAGMMHAMERALAACGAGMMLAINSSARLRRS